MHILSQKTALATAAVSAGLARASGFGLIPQAGIFAAGALTGGAIANLGFDLKSIASALSEAIFKTSLNQKLSGAALIIICGTAVAGVLGAPYFAANALSGTAFGQSAISAITSQIANPEFLSVLTHKFTQGVALTAIAAMGTEALVQMVALAK